MVRWVFWQAALLVLAASGTHAAPFLDGATRASLVVIGRLGAIRDIDLHGRRGDLSIEQVIGGQAPAARIVVAWEHLSRRGDAGPQEGPALLLALEPLPSSSLWRQRFTGESGAVWLVTAHRAAPPPPALAALTLYLGMPAEARDRAGGIAVLAQLAGSRSPLAGEAVERLGGIEALAEEIDAASTARLQAILLEADQPPELRRALLELVRRHRLVGMRPAVDQLARARSPLEADAIAAQAALDGGLPEARVARLLASPQPEVRAVAVRLARGSLAERELPRLVVADSAPAVRLAAAEALALAGTTWGLEGAVSAFADADGSVRSGASRAVAARGEVALPFLQAALQRGGPSAASAVATLALMGPAARGILLQAAASHPDATVRALAALALGKAPGHEH